MPCFIYCFIDRLIKEFYFITQFLGVVIFLQILNILKVLIYLQEHLGMSMKGCTHIYSLLGNYDNKLESKIAKRWSKHLEIDIPKECVRKSIETLFKICHIATNKFLY